MSIAFQNRSDGRLSDELRQFSLEWDPMSFALSSVIVRTGLTQVLCSVSIDEKVPKWRLGEEKGWLSAEYRLLPGSTPQRQKRELLHLSGRTQEVQRLIARSLRTVVDMKSLGERTFLVDCDVIQADAGTRTAAITGAWVALQRAGQRLVQQGSLSQNPIIGQVSAVSVGLLNGFPLLDLDYQEDSQADVDLNVVMDSNGSFLELQGTAERRPFTRSQLEIMLDMAEKGLRKLQLAQRSALEK